jgi:hypothetical protein
LENTEVFNRSNGQMNSYITFGGYNESQIVGGSKGLKNIPLIDEKYNPTFYWGVPAWGFAYGDKIVMDPEIIKEPLNSVIDSGTTLILFP